MNRSDVEPVYESTRSESSRNSPSTDYEIPPV